ncbi:MAG: DMT family transporter [Thermodesulfobacteriota bacterium]
MRTMIGTDRFGPKNTRFKGNFLGSIAVLMWGALPLLRVMADDIPPLQLTCMSLFMASLVTWVLSGHLKTSSRDQREPRAGRDAKWSALFLLGAVVFYFAALAKGPAAEVTLVTYLWPLGLSGLICIQTGRLPSIQMGTGVLLSFAGAALALLTRDGGSAWSGLEVNVLQGYALGLTSGLCWLGYSCMLKRLPADLGLHARIFAFAGIGAALLHILLENTAFHLSTAVLLAALIIGIGPYGLAFLAWGQGLRFGHPGLLSALCYTVPIVATTLLVLAGMETWRTELAIAALAVAIGAWISGMGTSYKSP